MRIIWSDFGEILLETFLELFFQDYGYFLKVKYSIGHISGMVGPIDMTRKRFASVGYLVKCMTLNFNLTHDIDLDFSRSNFEIAVSCRSAYCETKTKRIN